MHLPSVSKLTSTFTIFLALGILKPSIAQNYQQRTNRTIVLELNSLNVDVTIDSETVNLLQVLKIDGNTNAEKLAAAEERKKILRELLTIASDHAPSPIALPVIPDTCAEQSFGYDRHIFYNVNVCGTIQELESVCTREPGCDPSQIAAPLSDQGNFYLKDVELLAYFYCLEDNGLNATACTDYSAITSATSPYMVEASTFQNVVENHLPDGYNNIILSNYFGLFSSGVYVGAGALEINKRVTAVNGYNDQVMEKFMIRYKAMDAITAQYISAAASTDAEFLKFYNIMLKGYFVDSHAHFGFMRSAIRAESVKYTRLSGEGYPCAYALGVMASHKCGLIASDIYDFAEYYYNGYEVCGAPHIDNTSYQKAKAALKQIKSKAVPNRNPRACARRLRLFPLAV